MILAGLMPSFSARSLTVTPDSTLTGPVGTSGSRLTSGRGAAAVAALAGPAAGLRVDHDPAAAAGRGAALGPRLAGGLARLLRGHGGLGAERAAHVVVVDQVVRARGGAGRVKLLLDLSLRDALLAGDVCDRSFCHSVLNSPKPAAPAQPGSAARGRRRRLTGACNRLANAPWRVARVRQS